MHISYSVRNGSPFTSAVDAGSVSIINGSGSVPPGKYIAYYPPTEFNANPTPGSASEVLPNATRTVLLSIKGTFKGQPVSFFDRTIIVARPVTMLVHGIRSNAYSWRTDYGNTAPAGLYDSKLRIPLVAIDYSQISGSDFQQAMGPVEYGAKTLQQAIYLTRLQLSQGAFDPSFSKEIRSGIYYRGYTFHDYFGPVNDKGNPTCRLACRRVDVVAWSYGGVVTRWYLKSDGRNHSLNKTGSINYHWLDRTFDSSWITSYSGDVRKVITLGSMWRGVPLCNYVNEANFSSGSQSMNEAPIEISNPNGSNNLGGWVDGIFDPLVNTKMPAIEVMAVNSPWELWLNYEDGLTFPPINTARPFRSEVEYGSVAGSTQIYQALETHKFQPYEDIIAIQKPTWFPYLRLDSRAKALQSTAGFNDGIVPVWSAAIPGSYKIATCDHSNLATYKDATDYAIQWLNNENLPTGDSLNTIWNEPTSNTVSNGDNSGKWTFGPNSMAPDPQSYLYAPRNAGWGVEGCLAPNTFGPNAPYLYGIIASSSRQNGTITLSLLIGNIGYVIAPEVQVDSASISTGSKSIATSNKVPVSFGTILVGQKTSQLSFAFSGTLGSKGTKATLHLTAHYLYSPPLTLDTVDFMLP